MGQQRARKRKKGKGVKKGVYNAQRRSRKAAKKKMKTMRLKQRMIPSLWYCDIPLRLINTHGKPKQMFRLS